MKSKKVISVSAAASEARPHEAMDAETVAGLLGVTKRTLNNWLNDSGLPSQGSGRGRTFVWKDVLEWWFQYRFDMEMGGGNGGNEDGEDDAGVSDSDSNGRKEDIRQANLRKTRTEADIKQLQLAKLRGEVITIADAIVRLNRMLGNLRAKLLSMPPKLANRLEGMKVRTEIEGALKEELENLCREIATGAIVDLPAEATGAIDELAASADVPNELREAAELLSWYRGEADASV